jgi:hypothetical protein
MKERKSGLAVMHRLWGGYDVDPPCEKKTLSRRVTNGCLLFSCVEGAEWTSLFHSITSIILRFKIDTLRPRHLALKYLDSFLGYSIPGTGCHEHLYFLLFFTLLQ